MTIDPYVAPQAPTARALGPFPDWAIYVGVALALPFALICWFVAPQFAEAFAAFGARSPLPTQALLQAPWLGLMWPLAIGLDGWRLRKRNRGGLPGYLLRAGLGTVAMVVAFFVALYVPLFRVAATI